MCYSTGEVCKTNRLVCVEVKRKQLSSAGHGNLEINSKAAGVAALPHIYLDLPSHRQFISIPPRKEDGREGEGRGGQFGAALSASPYRISTQICWVWFKFRLLSSTAGATGEVMGIISHLPVSFLRFSDLDAQQEHQQQQHQLFPLQEPITNGVMAGCMSRQWNKSLPVENRLGLHRSLDFTLSLVCSPFAANPFSPSFYFLFFRPKWHHFTPDHPQSVNQASSVILLDPWRFAYPASRASSILWLDD